MLSFHVKFVQTIKQYSPPPPIFRYGGHKNITDPKNENCDLVENIVERGENAGYQHFFHFPTMFSNSFSSGLRKLTVV